MPRHAGTIFNRQSVANIIVNILEVHNTSVIEILTREQSLGKISRMDIRQWVSMGVPSPKTKIKTTDGGILIVYNNDLEKIMPLVICNSALGSMRTFSWWDQNSTLSEKGWTLIYECLSTKSYLWHRYGQGDAYKWCSGADDPVLPRNSG